MGQEDDTEAPGGNWEWELPDVCDDKSGRLLEPKLVEAAREKEVDFMRRIGLFEAVTVEVCWRKTGRPPMSTKWVDVSERHEESPDIKCRFPDVFAAMPTLEAKKMLPPLQTKLR